MLDWLWASDREERERGSNDDSAADAPVRPSKCLGNDDVLRTESAIYLTLSSESCNLWVYGASILYVMCLPVSIFWLVIGMSKHSENGGERNILCAQGGAEFLSSR
jgi:hypothetical protein